jgi:hypothetical protein
MPLAMIFITDQKPIQRNMKNLGIILIILGIALMVITGFNIVTQKKVVDIGPVEVNKEQNHPVQWSPIIGGVLFIAGIGVMLTTKKNNG